MAPADYNADLFQAILFCELMPLINCLNHGADINQRNQECQTPLSLAAESGHLTMATLLLQRGADVNRRAAIDETPLHLAAKNGHVAVVRILLQQGASVNPPDKYGWTPLYGASRNGHVRVVSVLLEHGADVNLTSKSDGWSPLSLASSRGHVHVVSLLLKHGATMEGDPDGLTPLHTASHCGKVNVVSVLLEHGADANAKKKEDGDTPLLLASLRGHEDVVSVLLEHGADIHAKKQDGATPLSAALSNKHVNVVSVLLEHGADLNATTKAKKGVPPLYYAAQRGQMDMVSVLLHHRPDLLNTKREGDGATPLHLALDHGHLENGHRHMVSVLMELGADINAKRDSDGATPLHIACGHGFMDMGRLLVEKGADTNQVFTLESNPRATAFYNAAYNQNWMLVACLLVHRTRFHHTFYFPPSNQLESVMGWMNKDESRTVLSLRELDGQGDSSEAKTNREILENWDLTVAFLWCAFCTDQNAEPPSIADTRSLTDKEFIEAHKWMIHASSSFFFVKHMLGLLQHLWHVLSPNDDAALTASDHTGMTPLMAALVTFGPKWAGDEGRLVLEGISFLMTKRTSDALQVRHPSTNRIPLACAIKRGIPLPILQEMVKGWAGSRIQLDAVTGLPIFLLVAVNYDVSDIYEFTRECMPDYLSNMTSGQDAPPVKDEGSKRKKPRIEE